MNRSSQSDCLTLTQRTNAGTLQTFTVDGKNQLTGTPTGTPSYDANGNMTYLPPASSGYGSPALTLTYDGENQLSSVVAQYMWKQEFVYDGKLRRRVRREYTFSYPNWVLSAEVHYVYDGLRVIQERFATSQAESYTRGSDLSGSMEGAGGIGGLLARTESYGWSVISSSSYHADGNGNITALVDGSQAIQASYRYDAYGNTLSKSGYLADANVYRFSSKEINASMLSLGAPELYYYGYRWYAPNLQRWLNQDPIGELGFEIMRAKRRFLLKGIGILDRSNLYRFVDNSPTRFFDPLGLYLPGSPECEAIEKDIANHLSTFGFDESFENWAGAADEYNKVLELAAMAAAMGCFDKPPPPPPSGGAPVTCPRWRPNPYEPPHIDPVQAAGWTGVGIGIGAIIEEAWPLIILAF